MLPNLSSVSISIQSICEFFRYVIIAGVRSWNFILGDNFTYPTVKMKDKKENQGDATAAPVEVEAGGESHSKRSKSPSIDNADRLEPKLLRAVENDDIERLEIILALARTRDQFNENFLRIGLMRSSEKGKINATRFLLDKGALPDAGGGGGGNRLSPLLRAVERNHIAIVHMLLEAGASPETSDKKGRTALMTAAWKNHWHILNSLISKGADVNAKDERGRNVLHNLAADKVCDWGDSVVELLLKTAVAIDGEQGQDKLGRTPLHWACATGKLRLAELLLVRSGVVGGGAAKIESTEIRGKTSLHLATAHGWDDIVDMLLGRGANIHARSDGGWTSLHNACEVGAIKIVRVLIAAGSDVNAKLLNGVTPLHLAAQAGHIEVVRMLLQCKDIKRAARDKFGSTAFLMAAQEKRRDIVELLSPLNNLETMSEDALGACQGFNVSLLYLLNLNLNLSSISHSTTSSVYALFDLVVPCNGS